MPPKTLLIPSLLDAHWPLLQWAFQSPAWTPVVLEGNRADVEGPDPDNLQYEVWVPVKK